MTGVALTRCSLGNTAGKKSIIQGQDATNQVFSVTLKDVTMDGVAITSTSYTSKITVGANVSKLSF